MFQTGQAPSLCVYHHENKGLGESDIRSGCKWPETVSVLTLVRAAVRARELLYAQRGLLYSLGEQRTDPLRDAGAEEVCKCSP